ncbi:MAG: N-acetylmuramoyl-L-alanine amidase [Candidatus Eremiobacteraeota bacterium]|jgi:N-acetylmuramoyl-L-alanine amidase|nr:N-acetylmuramoyl-L-alanine amidase [Candidatus Eremiobacteraeota bacterium]
MNRFRVRVFSLIALLFACALGAQAQERPPNVWFQGTRLIFDGAVAMQGDLAVSTRDAGLRRFLDRLGATVSYQPQQRYVVVTAEDRRTIVFTLGDPSYTAGGVRAQAPFAPLADGDDVVLPFYALARALYVEPVATPGEIVLQPRIGVLDVRTEGTRTTVTVRAAMPLVTTTNAESPEHVQLSFAGLGASLPPSRRAPGTAVDAIGVAVAGSVKVPTTTLTIDGVRGATHRVVASGSPDAYTVVFESRGNVAANVPPTPPPLAGWTPPPAGTAAPSSPPSGTVPPPTMAPLVVAGRATVTGLAIEPAADDALAVRVTLSGAASYEWHRLNDNRWYIDFQNTTLTGPGRDEHPSFGAVQSVRVRQTASTDAPAVRVAFTTTGQQRIDLAPSESGLVITVSTASTTEVARIGTGRTGGAAVVASAASPEPNAAPPATTGGGTTPAWKFGANNGSKIIVLDPGHGGADPGTQHNGLVEKLLTLDIAQRLRTLLVAQGWTVRMTRETDVDPVSSDNIAKMRSDGKPNPDDRAYLQTRCDVANNAGARLFISIHINSAPVESARGTTVYWYKPQDAPFAQAIEKNVIPLAGTQDDGTRHENFYVVRHTSMPAVLVETAFATNPGDVALLRQPSFLQNVAQGIANGVKAYAGSPSANALSQQQ